MMYDKECESVMKIKFELRMKLNRCHAKMPNLKKNFFRPQFGLKIRGRGAGPPGPSPGSALD